jgi:hypothetical protein
MATCNLQAKAMVFDYRKSPGLTIQSENVKPRHHQLQAIRALVTGSLTVAARVRLTSLRVAD